MLFGGVETGGTWCVCAIAGGPEEIVAEEQFPTTKPPQTLDRIVEFFQAGPKVEAIGIGSFGPVDLDPESATWGYVTTTPKPGWQWTSVAAVIRERLGVPVAFDNDVDAAALGEYRWGAGHGIGSLCYLTIGTGIGAGLLIDGQPWHGLVHPEVGHIRLSREHDRDSASFAGICPVHGDCWEGLASGPALEARWGMAPDQLPADHEAWAIEAEYIALGILSIVLVFSPERVIVGGGVMEHVGLLDAVRRRLRELMAGYLPTPLLGEEIESYLLAPQLDDRAGVLGAIALAQTARRC